MNNIRALYFGRIVVSEGTDVNKTKHQKSMTFITIGIS